MFITIKALQRSFVTDPEGWRGESLYFKKSLSGNWGGRQADGAYLIETDADIFEHILRYLRTGVLPVFFDRTAGHDFALYQALLAEAMYFGIDRLEKWLREQKYLDAVKIHYLTTETRDRGSYSRHTSSISDGSTFMVEDRFIDITTSANMDTTITPITQQVNVFYCPDAKHGKSTEEYCRSCIDRARKDGTPGYGGWRTEDRLLWGIVRKEIVFDHDLCVKAYTEDE